MKPAAHLPPAGAKRPVLLVTAILACSIAFGGSYAMATTTATTSKSLTQAQKLSKALKACKKQPKRKRAACAKRAKRKYASHSPVTPSTGPATPMAPVTSPTGPVTPTPAAGSTAPPGPTLAWLQQQLCASPVCDANHQILKLTILTAGTPRLGTGIDTTRGGDGVPSTTWIYPLTYSYDSTDQVVCHVTSAYCPDAQSIQTTFYTETTHLTATSNAQLSAAGALQLFKVAGVPTTATCDPDPMGCTNL